MRLNKNPIILSPFEKYYPFLTIFFIMVASLCCISCSGDDETEEGHASSGNKTLVIDGQPFYCGKSSSVEQTDGRGMYLIVYATEDANFEWNGKKLVAHISPSKVSQLHVGDVFNYNEIAIQHYNNVSAIELNTYSWEGVKGYFTIKSIQSKELTIQINQFVVEHTQTHVTHSIDGTATLHNSLHDSQWNVLPFSEF